MGDQLTKKLSEISSLSFSPSVSQSTLIGDDTLDDSQKLLKLIQDKRNYNKEQNNVLDILYLGQQKLDFDVQIETCEDDRSGDTNISYINHSKKEENEFFKKPNKVVNSPAKHRLSAGFKKSTNLGKRVLLKEFEKTVVEENQFNPKCISTPICKNNVADHFKNNYTHSSDFDGLSPIIENESVKENLIKDKENSEFRKAQGTKISKNKSQELPDENQNHDFILIPNVQNQSMENHCASDKSNKEMSIVVLETQECLKNKNNVPPDKEILGYNTRSKNYCALDGSFHTGKNMEISVSKHNRSEVDKLTNISTEAQMSTQLNCIESNNHEKLKCTEISPNTIAKTFDNEMIFSNKRTFTIEQNISNNNFCPEAHEENRQVNISNNAAPREFCLKINNSSVRSLRNGKKVFTENSHLNEFSNIISKSPNLYQYAHQRASRIPQIKRSGPLASLRPPTPFKTTKSTDFPLSKVTEKNSVICNNSNKSICDSNTSRVNLILDQLQKSIPMSPVFVMIDNNGSKNIEIDKSNFDSVKNNAKNLPPPPPEFTDSFKSKKLRVNLKKINIPLRAESNCENSGGKAFDIRNVLSSDESNKNYFHSNKQKGEAKRNEASNRQDIEEKKKKGTVQQSVSNAENLPPPSPEFINSYKLKKSQVNLKKSLIAKSFCENSGSKVYDIDSILTSDESNEDDFQSNPKKAEAKKDSTFFNNQNVQEKKKKATTQQRPHSNANKLDENKSPTNFAHMDFSLNNNSKIFVPENFSVQPVDLRKKKSRKSSLLANLKIQELSNLCSSKKNLSEKDYINLCQEYNSKCNNFVSKLRKSSNSLVHIQEKDIFSQHFKKKHTPPLAKIFSDVEDYQSFTDIIKETKRKSQGNKTITSSSHFPDPSSFPINSDPNLSENRTQYSECFIVRDKYQNSLENFSFPPPPSFLLQKEMDSTLEMAQLENIVTNDYAKDKRLSRYYRFQLTDEKNRPKKRSISVPVFSNIKNHNQYECNYQMQKFNPTNSQECILPVTKVYDKPDKVIIDIPQSPEGFECVSNFLQNNSSTGSSKNAYNLRKANASPLTSFNLSRRTNSKLSLHPESIQESEKEIFFKDKVTVSSKRSKICMDEENHFNAGTDHIDDQPEVVQNLWKESIERKSLENRMKTNKVKSNTKNKKKKQKMDPIKTTYLNLTSNLNSLKSNVSINTTDISRRKLYDKGHSDNEIFCNEEINRLEVVVETPNKNNAVQNEKNMSSNNNSEQKINSNNSYIIFNNISSSKNLDDDYIFKKPKLPAPKCKSKDKAKVKKLHVKNHISNGVTEKEESVERDRTDSNKSGANMSTISSNEDRKQLSEIDKLLNSLPLRYKNVLNNSNKTTTSEVRRSSRKAVPRRVYTYWANKYENVPSLTNYNEIIREIYKSDTPKTKSEITRKNLELNDIKKKVKSVKNSKKVPEAQQVNQPNVENADSRAILPECVKGIEAPHFDNSAVKKNGNSNKKNSKRLKNTEKFEKVQKTLHVNQSNLENTDNHAISPECVKENEIQHSNNLDGENNRKSSKKKIKNTKNIKTLKKASGIQQVDQQILENMDNNAISSPCANDIKIQHLNNFAKKQNKQIYKPIENAENEYENEVESNCGNSQIVSQNKPRKRSIRSIVDTLKESFNNFETTVLATVANTKSKNVGKNENHTHQVNFSSRIKKKKSREKLEEKNEIKSNKKTSSRKVIGLQDISGKSNGMLRTKNDDNGSSSENNSTRTASDNLSKPSDIATISNSGDHFFHLIKQLISVTNNDNSAKLYNQNNGNNNSFQNNDNDNGVHRFFSEDTFRMGDITKMDVTEKNGVSYIFYREIMSKNLGFIKFMPGSKKPKAKSKAYDLNFLSLFGDLDFHIGGEVHRSVPGSLSSVPKDSSYLIINNSNEKACLFFIKVMNSQTNT